MLSIKGHIVIICVPVNCIFRTALAHIKDNEMAFIVQEQGLNMPELSQQQVNG